MKLFKSLLVAPAALGLMSPLAANASEVNLNDISNYSDVDSIEFANSFGKSDSNKTQLLAGGEGLVDSHDGGFSQTTTASFSADFYLGGVDGGTTATNDPFMATYGFQIDLNTSFTGEDSLDISLDAGNTSTTTTSVAEFDGNATGDNLVVDGVMYTFPIGTATAFVGDNTDGSALFTTACTYGGPTNTLDDCGNVNAGITNGGVAAGASYDFGNGFTAAVGYAGATEDTGIMTEETLDAYGLNAAYTGDNYGLSATYGVIESTTGSPAVLDDNEDSYLALNAYYTPEGNLPSVSVGYEIGDDGSKTSLEEITSFFLGLQWDEVGPGSAGLAMGHSGTIEGAEEEYMYEAYYSYPVNDGMTITPVVYIKESATSGQDDATGVMVKTSFSF
tara:strand:- start:181 stop:1350 length:1170 start_codon:yes stop_codon:yes gene_type:complete